MHYKRLRFIPAYILATDDELSYSLSDSSAYDDVESVPSEQPSHPTRLILQRQSDQRMNYDAGKMRTLHTINDMDSTAEDYEEDPVLAILATIIVTLLWFVITLAVVTIGVTVYRMYKQRKRSSEKLAILESQSMEPSFGAPQASEKRTKGDYTSVSTHEV